MDSLTQIALGSAVGVAVMGRRTAIWKAALWGAIGGTLPDLDVVINHGNPVLNMVRHRAESHSLFYLTLFAPLLAWVAARVHSEASGEAWGPERSTAGPPQGGSAPSGGSDPRSSGAWGPTRATAGPPQGGSAPSGGSDPHSGGAWGPERSTAGPPQGGSAPSGGSDPRSGGAWGPNFQRWWLAMWLVLITHPLLDTMTVYGTQLLMPFSNHPFAVGSVFIIDPAYTLPLIVGVVAALRLKGSRGLAWNAVALAISTAYLGWGAFAQHKVTTIARASLPSINASPDNLLVTAGPFNTVLWRLVATTPDHYFEGHYSLLDAEPKVLWTAYPRGAEWIAAHGHTEAVARIAAFSHGFYKLQLTEGHLMLTDLRMGQEPAYTFRFDLGKPSEVGIAAIQQRSMRPDLASALPLLWRRIKGLPRVASVAEISNY